MKVSIIIPVYNAEKYLAECIESALNQTYKNIEIIAVNDGSTDNSLKILKQYSDRIKIIEQTNKGPANAYNTGIKASIGDWIKKLDADDLLYEKALEILIKTTKRFGEDAKSFIFYTNYELIDSSGKKLYDFVEPNYNNLSKFERDVILLDHCVGNHITSLIHRSVFKKCGFFNEQINFVSDYEFWLRCQLLYNYKFLLIPEITAKYRIHESQLTQTKFKIVAKNSRIVRNMILEQVNDEIKEKYVKEFKKYQKNKYPKKIRVICCIRDFTLKVLPDPLSAKILEKCLKSKKINEIYKNAILSWKEN